YSLDIAGVQSEVGIARLIAGLVIALAAGALAWASWELLKGPRLHALEAAIEQERDAAKHEIEESKTERDH
ncbi:MAG TPA: hypothetical protein VFO36_04795, partial [Nitrospiraceae bacterium]|nr:hypothetical protein [Nitrospiraceae bacterium]